MVKMGTNPIPSANFLASSKFSYSKISRPAERAGATGKYRGSSRNLTEPKVCEAKASFQQENSEKSAGTSMKFEKSWTCAMRSAQTPTAARPQSSNPETRVDGFNDIKPDSLRLCQCSGNSEPCWAAAVFRAVTVRGSSPWAAVIR
jgi:hypothetical protein